MVSLMIFSPLLNKHYGNMNFLAIIIVLLVGCSSIALGINYVMTFFPKLFEGGKYPH